MVFPPQQRLANRRRSLRIGPEQDSSQVALAASRVAVLAGLALLAALTACLPAPAVATAPPPTVTGPPSPTITATATVVWFPPTATFTPFPTEAVTPTPEMRTGIGAILLHEEFDDAGGWELKATSAGVVSVANHELSLAIVEPRGFLFSTLAGFELGDFYLEVTAGTSLCLGMDEYGLMIRVNPGPDYYRYSVSCDGQVRLDRIYRGGAAGLVPWTPGGGVPRGAPSQTRLAVWAVGEEMRFFVEDHFQFSVRDPLMSRGAFGVFARSAGDTAVTVSFSDLDVWEASP